MQPKLSTTTLFQPETIYTSTATSQVEVFKEIAQKLYQRNLVTASFVDNLIDREIHYPTGMDLSVISSHYPNIAIPHTECEFVKTRRIIPVKLINPLTFHSMIAPASTLEVHFLFMILNDDPEGQVNVLAQIMDFISQTPSDQLEHFFKLTTPNEIYQFLNQNFGKFYN
jgi:PTS system galactitol-specific IIA component